VLAWRRLFALAAALVLAMAGAGPVCAAALPVLTGRVVDDAHLLRPDQIAALDSKLAGLEAQSRRQLVVVTVPGLDGEDIADFGVKLGRAWGIGSKQRNDGLLLIIAPIERKARVEVGYGLEGIVTDALSDLIIRHDMAPRFRNGDYAGGINAAVDNLIAQLQLPDDEARSVASQAAVREANETRPHADAGTVVFAVIFVLFFVLPFLRVLRGGGRRYGGGVWIIPGGGWGGGGGWSGGGGWGGGGGGFSGGGGSFGGGGASGGW